MSLYPDHGSSLWQPPKISEPRPIVPAVPVVPPEPKKCNMHDDCDAADMRAAARGVGTDHCWDDCCEDCFGC